MELMLIQGIIAVRYWIWCIFSSGFCFVLNFIDDLGGSVYGLLNWQHAFGGCHLCWRFVCLFYVGIGR